MKRFLVSLQGMDSETVGALVANATHMRHMILSSSGIDLLYPEVAEQQHHYIGFELTRLIKKCQAANDMQMASGLFVWLHTVRAVTALELRLNGRLIWRELKRGFPHTKEAAEVFQMITGLTLRIDGYDSIPVGLEPL
jgi:hypothetical protein